MDEARLEALIKEAIAHCYDDEDIFWGIFSALVGNVTFPFQANVGTITGLDGHASAPEVGILARVQQGGQETGVPLDEVEPVDAPPATQEWLAAYRLWWRGFNRRGGGG